MATAEPSPSSLGPRYAPDDPTLPQPWKGLIDGSTGLLYYWNPETNVTQYEKPEAAPAPVAPAAAATPKLNPIPAARATELESIQSQQNQQMMQNQLPQGQAMSSSYQQQAQPTLQSAQQQVIPPGQMQGPQYAHAMQQGHVAPDQARQQSMQHTAQQVPPQYSQIPMHPGQQGPPQASQQVHTQTGAQAPYQQIQPMAHNAQGQMRPSHGYQFTPQQTQYTMHQPNMPPQGPYNSSQQQHHMLQRPQLPQQQDPKVGCSQREDIDFHHGKQAGLSPAQQPLMQWQKFQHPSEQKPGVSHRDDVVFQQGKQAGYSSVQLQQSGTSPLQSMPVGNNTTTAVMHTQPGQSTLYGGSSAYMQHNKPAAADFANLQHGPKFPNQMGPGMMHGPQKNLPPLGSRTPYEENHAGRPGEEYFYNSNKDVNAIQQMPKLAPLPGTRNQQEMRTGNLLPAQTGPHHLPGGFNGPGGPPFHGAHGILSGPPPYQNNAFVRPPMPLMGLSDPHNLSAEVYRQKHEVTATGDDVPPPFMTFEASGLPPELLREIDSAGFKAPTPIQAQTWPIALQNKDIVAIAKTGSGKTLGYLVPAFIHLRRRQNNRRNGPTVLVLAPTRELATQIKAEAIKFGGSSRVSCTCLYGGAPKHPQLEELDRGTDIVVATPGRLNDILEMKRVDFRQISLLVLDEADRMLDMGFEPQIRKIVNEIPPSRQTLMYTATWPKEVIEIAGDLLSNPVQVTIGSVDELAANKSITQYVEVVPEFEKQRRLEQILRSQEPGSKVIIFCSTKRLCDHLTRSIGRNFGAAAIHGDKSQSERDWVLNQFRSGKSPVLVATDVAARGLDIRDIRVVVNYDFPTGVEDYVHRIGRTGRAGATGIAYTFFSEQDWKHAPELIKVLEGANQVVPPEVRDIALRGGPGFGKDRGAVNRYDSADGGGRWDSGSRGGMRDGGFGGRGGTRDGGPGGRGGMRDGGFGGRGGMRDGGFGGRVGGRDGGFGGRGGMRDGGFGGRGGMRDGNFGGQGGRDGGFGGRGGWDRGGRGPNDRFNDLDVRGRGRGRGRGRFDGRRDGSDRSRGRSYSQSPDRVRTWDYSRSRSRSRSLSRSRSRSRGRSYSRSRSRSWSRSRSPRRSRSRTPKRSRSRSYERRPPRKSKFDVMEVPAPNAAEVVIPPAQPGEQPPPSGPAAELGNPGASFDPKDQPALDP